MKAKLIRRDNGEFYLIDENNKITSHHHLSKQNCDEIFGVVDVEELAEENTKIKEGFVIESSQVAPYRLGFRNGFNKEVELNGDKRFTLEDLGNLWDFCVYNKGTFAEFIQQLKEIDVEIEMVKVVDKTKMIGAVKGVKGSGHKIKTYKSVPKLDLSECLILKKI